MNAWEWAGIVCIALTVAPASIYLICKMAVMGYYKGKSEGQSRPRNYPHTNGKG